MIVYTQGKARPKQLSYATTMGELEDEALAILIDGWSASASEIVAGAIQDNDRGTIIGRRSFGKGLVQEPTMFRDGSALRLTIARYYTPSGRCIQKPYDEGREAYAHDLIERYNNGEMEHPDSSAFKESEKYYTVGGRVVYGGGGIMPDIFVPLDTIGYTGYFREVSAKAIIYNFALDFTEKHRKQLEKFSDYRQLVQYLNNSNIFIEFLKYARSKGIKDKPNEIKISRKIIETQIKAYIARNIFDNAGYYPVIRQIDNVLQKAVEVMSTK